MLSGMINVVIEKKAWSMASDKSEFQFNPPLTVDNMIFSFL